jgi:molybdate/tungstate transport system substrate-binding protein
MWQNPTSMRLVGTIALAVGIAAVCAVAGFAGGWFAHPGPASSTAGDLAIIAAGSLAPAKLLPALASEFANDTPGISAPSSLQLYEGSTDAATALAGGGQPYDIFVAADFRVIPQHLESIASPVASWEVVFASDPIVLAYNSSVPALKGVTSSNWSQAIVASGVTLGAPNASSDPLGVNAIVVLELEDALEGDGGSFYGHFYTGGEGALAVPTDAVRTVVENVAATALATGEVDAYLIYQSYAVADGLTYISLSPSVNLGGTSPPDVANYGTVSTKVYTSTGTATDAGAPVLFALTVPSTAPHPVLGLAFAEFLMSNATESTLTADGFSVLAPLWTDQPSHLPAVLSGSTTGGVEPLPSYLATLIP